MNKYKRLAKKSREMTIKAQSCDRKKKFNNKSEAELNKGQDVYLCRFCGKWHRSGSIGRTLIKLRGKNFKGYAL